MDKLKSDSLLELYEKFKPAIINRINQFLTLRNGNEEEILKEFIFCSLTPQSKAKVCWEAAQNIYNVFKRSPNLHTADLKKNLKGVRFPNNKAKFITENFRILREKNFSLKELVSSNEDSKVKREIMVRSFKGYGMKEASHFLRNTGHLDLAILDRHILRNMKEFGIIEEIPNSLTKSKYLELEEKLKELCEKVKIPFAHLDLLLWAKETGEVFK